FQNGFDAAYDWTEDLGEWAWRGAYDDPSETVERLKRAIGVSLESGPGFVFRVFDNNDTRARFITRYGLEGTPVATGVLMTLPGVPSLYAGEEGGAAFEPYGGAMPPDGDNPAGLKSYYSQLAWLRHANPALRSRALEILDLGPESSVLGYWRGEGSNR